MAANLRSEMDKQSDELLHMLCPPCKRNHYGENKEADKYCADCYDYYCSDCVKFHGDIPALSGHKILDKGQVNDGTSDTLPATPTQRCEKHRFKPIDMYCQSHDNVGCSTCMAVDHRSCDDVFYVPEYVFDHDPTSQCEKVNRKVQAVTCDFEFQLKIRQREIKRLYKRKEEEVEKIKQFRIDINHKLDNLEKKSIDHIEDEYKALIKTYEEQITILTTFHKDVQSSARELKSAMSNLSQKFVGMKVANSVTETADNGWKEMEIQFKRIDLVFEGQQKLITMVDQINKLGKLVEKPAIYRLGEKREISIKHDSDGSTYYDIHSICMLKDGSVIIADRYNESLKRLDMISSKIVDACKLSTSPWQVCEVDNEIAVSSARMNIKFVTTEHPLKVTREMKTEHRCYGLGYKNGKIYVTDSNETILVYNKTGKILSQFSKDQSGDNLFSNIISLTVSQDVEIIYVADNRFADSTYGIVVISKEGHLFGKYNYNNLSGLREICETDNGDILVCGELSNNIVQFYPNGEVVGEILASDGKVGGCTAVCFDCNFKRLIVRRNRGYHIEVYDII